MRVLSWVVVNVVALAAATWLVAGISVSAVGEPQRVWTVGVVGVVLGAVTAVVRPVVTLLALPLVLLTLGLLLVVVNAALLVLTGAVAARLGLAFHVDGFGSALLGSVVVSVVSWLVGAALPGTSRSARRRR